MVGGGGRRNLQNNQEGRVEVIALVKIFMIRGLTFVFGLVSSSIHR